MANHLAATRHHSPPPFPSILLFFAFSLIFLSSFFFSFQNFYPNPSISFFFFYFPFMENWRLAVLSSHLRPTSPSDSRPVSPSICGAGSDSGSSSSSENGDTDFCVFCKIIRGQSPALKVIVLYAWFWALDSPFLSSSVWSVGHRNAYGRIFLSLAKINCFRIEQFDITLVKSKGKTVDELIFFHFALQTLDSQTNNYFGFAILSVGNILV